MGVIEVEFSEIRSLTKAILAGAIDKETAALALKGFSESGKRVDQYIKVVAMTINHGKSARQLVDKNIISSGSAIDMFDDSARIEEKVKCPAAGDLLVSRGECLDYSGDNQHIGSCQKCGHFTTTRKQLFPL